jgi:outer membrane protein TolC
MKSVKKYTAVLGVLLTAAPASFGQSRYVRGPDLPTGNYFSTFTSRYKSVYVPPIDMSNTTRAEQLIRAGNLYLSLNDAIDLSLENNLGLEIQRYQFPLAAAAYLGSYGQYDQTFNINTFNFLHSASPVTQVTTGGSQPVNITETYNRNFNFQQPFSSGATVTLGYTAGKSITNNTTSIFAPSLSGGLTLNATQPLLRGFGVAMNNVPITQAKNNQRNADYAFQQQVNTLLNNVIGSYWNLVSAVLNVDVARQSLDLSNKLYEQNSKQVEIGTMAPIDIKQTEVQVAQNEQALIAAQTAVQTQEIALKNILSRNGVSSPVLGPVHIIPTSRVEVPAVEAVVPVQDLIDTALQKRPELAQTRITLENTALNMKVSRNNLLPSLNLVGQISQPAQSGTVNPTYCDLHNPVQPGCARLPLTDYIGGYSNVLRQLFTVPLVNWQVGLNFSLNLRNRSQQATMQQQQLQYRTSELQLQNQTNQYKADVQTALANILRARAQFAAADRAVSAQEAVVDAEQRKFQLGASTLFVVIQQQNTLASTRQQLVTAQVGYATAKLSLDVATGTLMDKYNLIFDEAKEGLVSRRPDPIPDITQTPGQNANLLLPTTPNPR